MKNVLILGIGNAQVDAVKVCKELGHKVYTLSYIMEGNAREWADHFELIDITDIDGVMNYARDLNIDVVYSVGSDIAIPTACAVSERLGLPHFVSYETARTCLNKDQLRKAIGNDGSGNINYRVISEKSMMEEIKPDFPLVMKPVDSQGQRGVRLVHSAEEFNEYFEITQSYSRQRKVILEDYIDGPEISVNAYLVDSEIKFFAISDRIVWPQFPGGIIHKHIVPSRAVNQEIGRKIFALVNDTAIKMDILNGPSYFQIKLKNTEPKIIEVTPRLDGCHLWRLLKHATSIDLLKITFKHLLGEVPAMKTIQQPMELEPYVLQFMCEEPGKIVDQSNYLIPDHIFLRFYYDPGQEVKPLNGYYEKIGYFIKKCN